MCMVVLTIRQLFTLLFIASVVARRGRLVTASTSKKCLKLWSVAGISELVLPGSTMSTNVEVEDEITLDGFVTAMMFDDTLDMVRAVYRTENVHDLIITKYYLIHYRPDHRIKRM